MSCNDQFANRTCHEDFIHSRSEVSDHVQIVQAATDIRKSFHLIFRWPELLDRAKEITIKGCIDKWSIDVLQNFHHRGWHFAKNIMTPEAKYPTRQGNVMRTWDPIG